MVFPACLCISVLSNHGLQEPEFACMELKTDHLKDSLNLTFDEYYHYAVPVCFPRTVLIQRLM